MGSVSSGRGYGGANSVSVYPKRSQASWVYSRWRGSSGVRVWIKAPGNQRADAGRKLEIRGELVITVEICSAFIGLAFLS